MVSRKTLSVFVDESGDLGGLTGHSPYYFFTLVFHNQADDIRENVARLNQWLAFDGFENHAIHTGPLIRREKDYEHLGISERRTLFKRIYYFARKSPVKYKTFMFKKSEFREQFELISRMSRSLSEFIHCNMSFFSAFDSHVIYYDNGQHELNKILVSAFSALFQNVDYRTVLPADYRLFQVADLICTLELIRAKLSANCLSASEKHFFDIRELRKTYLAGIDSLRFIEC